MAFFPWLPLAFALGYLRDFALRLVSEERDVDGGREAKWFQFTLSEALIGSGMLGVIVSLVTLALEEEPVWIIVKTVLSFICSAVVAFVYAVTTSRARKDGSSESNWRMVRAQLLAWPLGFVLFVISTDALLSRRKRSFVVGAAACKTILEAQEIYRRSDYDGDGHLEYSPTLSGLYETTPEAHFLGMVHKGMAEAESSLAAPIPCYGYVFTVLTARGKDAAGGAKSYIDANGNLTGGVGILAYPSPYNSAAKKYDRMSYMIDSSTGLIYMRDFGAQTPVVAPTIREFNPDTNWALTD